MLFRYNLESSDAIPLDDDIRVHSCPFVPIRGSGFFSCISCPFVVLYFLFVYFVCFVVQSIRVHSWFLDQFQKKQAASDVFLK